MKPATHRSWLGRALIVAVVAAGAAAMVVGALAGLPAVRSAAATKAASAKSPFVARPPDVEDAAVAAATTPDAIERYMSAHPYGLNGTTPDAIERYMSAHPYGLTATGLTSVGRPPDARGATLAAHAIAPGQSSGFAWTEYAIGVGSGIGLVLIAVAGLAIGKRRLHHVRTA